MTEATTVSKLDYILVQNSIDDISSEVHYRFVGVIDTVIESYSTLNEAMKRMNELCVEHGIATQLTDRLTSSKVYSCEECKEAARIDGARAFAEWFGNDCQDATWMDETFLRWLASENKEEGK